jgi:hypothetical protein
LLLKEKIYFYDKVAHIMLEEEKVNTKKIHKFNMQCIIVLAPNSHGIHILDDEWIQTCSLDKRTCCCDSSKFV